jgi:predicted permease
MRGLYQDLRYAARRLATSPGFTAVAVVTLALGIGANTAIFSFVNAALLRPLPYASPDRLFTLSEARELAEAAELNASYPDLLDWQKSTKTFETLAGYAGDAVTVTGSGAPESLNVARGTTNFLHTLGVSPVLGRDFQSGEDQLGAKVVLLSFGYWKSHFAGNPHVLGQTLRLDGVNHTIVGVLPANFEFAPAGTPILWLPLDLSAEFVSRRNLRWLKVVGRLKDSVNEQQALAEMRTINAGLAAAYPKENAAIQIVMTSLRERITGRLRPLLLVLLGAVGFVLLIACANVAHLMLARATTRRKEIAIRKAMGARRVHLIRQLLTESILLSLVGAALSFIFASWGIGLLTNLLPEQIRTDLPFLNAVQLDSRTFLFLLGVAFLTGIVVGLVPAWQLSRPDSGEVLKEESRSSSGKGMVWLRDGLVVAELGLSIVLLTGAGLMVRSLNSLLKQDPGFEGRHLLTFIVNLPQDSYKDEAAALQFEHRLSDALNQLPGVQGTAVVSRLPVTQNGNTIRFVIEGHPKDKGAEDEVNIRNVSPSYFPLMKIPTLQGRGYTLADDAKGPSRMIVNQAFVDRYLPGENPIGKRVKFTYSDALPFQEIIGVVANENTEGLDVPMQPIIYSSYEQGSDSGFYVLMRTAQDPDSVTSAARSTLQGIDPQLPMIQPRSMELVISNSYAVLLRRFPSRIITGFALLALTLAAVGLYGQISFSVGERTKEIGVRMALGADSRAIIRLIIAKAFALTFGGLLLGFAAALALTRLLASLLFGVTPLDPLTIGAAAMVLTFVAVLASLIPALRATRVDPLVALRYE